MSALQTISLTMAQIVHTVTFTMVKDQVLKLFRTGPRSILFQLSDFRPSNFCHSVNLTMVNQQLYYFYASQYEH